MQLNKEELLHLIGRFDFIHRRPKNCTLLHKEVVELKNKLLDEYYVRSRQVR